MGIPNYYKNGDYKVKIDMDGTKRRWWDAENPKAEFAESIDCMITYKCDNNCPFCYANCTKDGKHAELDSEYVDKFIKSLHPSTELAINGNDFDIPYLYEFLKKLRDQGVFVNVTFELNQFHENIHKIHEYKMEGLIHGIGISVSNCDSEDFNEPLGAFVSDYYPELIPSIVFHVIAGVVSVDNLIRLSNKGYNLLILGYKTHGRGVKFAALDKDDHDRINYNIKNLSVNLNYFLRTGRFKTVSFDNLALEQLHVKDNLDDWEWDEIYMGEDGEFTYFVDLVNMKFAKNSISDKLFDIDDKDSKQMFDIIRSN